MTHKKELFPSVMMAVIGRASSGKSTLMNAFVTLGTPYLTLKEIVITDAMMNQPLEEWVEDASIYFYCIHARQESLTIEEQQLIHQLARRKKVILVLTQSIGMHSEERRRLLEEAQLGVDGIVAVMAKSYPIYESVTMPVFGLEELLDQLMETMPDAYEETVIAMQKVNIALKIDSAKNCIDEWLQEQFGFRLQQSLPFTVDELIGHQQPLLEQLMVYFTQYTNCSDQEVLLHQFLHEERRIFLKEQWKIHTPITGITASILTYSFAISMMEILAMSYKKQVVSMEGNNQLLEAKCEQRLKLGKQNPAIQRLMRMNHYQLEKRLEQSLVVHPSPVKVSRKGTHFLQKTQKRVAKLAHDSLDAFSRWARK